MENLDLVELKQNEFYEVEGGMLEVLSWSISILEGMAEFRAGAGAYFNDCSC